MWIERKQRAWKGSAPKSDLQHRSATLQKLNKTAGFKILNLVSRKTMKKHQGHGVQRKNAGSQVSPVNRQREIVLPLDADVWVPLGQGLRVLLKHPLVASGDAAAEQSTRTHTHTQSAEFILR